MNSKYVASGIVTLFSLLIMGCNPKAVQFTEREIFAADMASLCTDLSAEAVIPKLKWDWYAQLDKSIAENYPDYNQVMSSPMVADLNGDKKPEVVFVTFKGGAYNSPGVLRIVDGATGNTLRSIGVPELAPFGSTTPLLIDIDGDRKVEIFYSHSSGKSVVALNYDGSQRWIFPVNTAVQGYRGYSAIDSDKNGKAEIIVGGFSITEDVNRTPYIFWQSKTNLGAGGTFAINLNPSKPEELSYVNYAGIVNSVGTMTSSMAATFVSAADIDNVPGLEIVGTGGGAIRIYDGLTGAKRNEVDLNSYNDFKCGKGVGGGPATLGDFDGNVNTTEIAVATGRFLAIFDNTGGLMAKYPTQDCSSLSTGISSFDFNGDGTPEILYGDEEYFRIFELKDGELKVVWSTVNPSGTLHEYPIVVDLDGNKSSEMLVVANSYAANNFYRDPGEEADRAMAIKITGVRAFEPTGQYAWMPTRSLWNAFDYNPALVTDQLKSTFSTPFDSFTARMFRRNAQIGSSEMKCR